MNFSWRVAKRWMPSLVVPGLIALAQSPQPVAAQPLFEYLGQYGDVHTPYTDHDVRETNRTGEIIGVSSGRGAATLISAWVARPDGVQHRLGYFSDPYISATGDFFSFPNDLTESGYVIGTSMRYEPEGTIAWLATTDGAIERVGYHDALHTGAAGQQFSRVEDVTEWGLVLGSSARFLAGADAGRTAWLALPGGHIRSIGFVDARHTQGGGSQGYRESESYLLNERGVAAGYSTNFGAGAVPGKTAWFGNAKGETYRIGYYDARHTGPDGRHMSYPLALNQANDILGVSQRFVGNGGTDDAGEITSQSAWIANTAGEIHALGLLDAVHTAPDGFRLQTYLGALTQSGYTTGASLRFDHGLTASDYSTSAWIANRDGVTQEVGLYDAEHTRSDGAVSNTALQVIEAGWVAGVAQRYAGTESLGESTWIARFGGTTRRIGLTDAAHTSPSGRQKSMIVLLNPNGAIVGYSSKFHPDDRVASNSLWITPVAGGSTVVFAEVAPDTPLYTHPAGFVYTRDWVYNTSNRQMIRPSGRIYGVTNDGVIYGQTSSERAFAWIPGRGQVDVAAQCDTPLSEDGWEQWFDVVTSSTAGHLVGRGWLAGSNREHHLVYLLRRIE